MADVIPGRQYLGVTCRKCGELAPFVEVDPGTKLTDAGGTFEVVCLHCGHKADYPATAFRLMKAHQKH